MTMPSAGTPGLTVTAPAAKALIEFEGKVSVPVLPDSVATAAAVTPFASSTWTRQRVGIVMFAPSVTVSPDRVPEPLVSVDASTSSAT